MADGFKKLTITDIPDEILSGMSIPDLSALLRSGIKQSRERIRRFNKKLSQGGKDVQDYNNLLVEKAKSYNETFLQESTGVISDIKKSSKNPATIKKRLIGQIHYTQQHLNSRLSSISGMNEIVEEEKDRQREFFESIGQNYDELTPQDIREFYSFIDMINEDIGSMTYKLYKTMGIETVAKSYFNMKREGLSRKEIYNKLSKSLKGKYERRMKETMKLQGEKDEKAKEYYTIQDPRKKTKGKVQRKR